MPLKIYHHEANSSRPLFSTGSIYPNGLLPNQLNYSNQRRLRLPKRKFEKHQYSVEVIEAMPEEYFDYKPTPDVLSFREQAVHIAYAIEWNILLMQKKPVDWVPGNRLEMSQAELSAYARAQFVHFENFVDTSIVNPVFTEQIVDVLSHNAHHRGQMTTYLRLRGIKPTAYR
ncbi:MAG: DinB family protein [Bacteroidota bacterium]